MDDLELEVKVLRDCYNSLATDQERLKEMNAFLEQRVRSLERQLSAEPLPSPRAALDLDVVKAPPTAVCPEGEGDGKVELYDVKDEAKAHAADDEDDLLVEHCLGETIWDGAIFVGLPELTPGGSFILCLSMLLNAVVQVYICVVLFTSDDFIQFRQYRDIKRPMLEFRLNTGHDQSQVDARGRSLVSRVCEDDQSLSLGFRQADILAEINAYLGMEPSDLVREHFGTGPLLCGVCIFLFAATVLQELRSVVEATYAVCALPRGPRTVLEDGRISAIHRGRFACVLVNNVVRTGVAMMLLVTGFIWLAATSSITDLILNAAALSFIMDMDECLFLTTVPVGVHKVVKGVEALRYRRSRWNSEAIVPLLAMVGIVWLSFFALVNPNTEDMLMVKHAICGGSKTFMVQQNEVGFIVATKTLEYEEDAPFGLKERAVQELVDTPIGSGAVSSQFSYYSEAPSTFLEWATKTQQSWTENAECMDQDTMFGGAMMLTFPQIFTTVRYFTGRHAGLTLLDRPFSCSEYRDFCQTVPFVRSTCAITCGCDDPFSGLLRVHYRQGCSGRCAPLRAARLQNLSCTDVPNAANTTAWRQYWTNFKRLWLQDQTDPVILREAGEVFDRKLAEGCSNDELLPVANVTDCDNSQLVMASNGMASLTASFCPGRCCQGPNLPAECPGMCFPASGAGAPRPPR